MKQGWEIKKLEEVVTFQRGLTYSKNDEVEFSCNGVLRSNNIDLDTMSLVFDELKYVREDLVIAPDKKLSKGSILICMSNGSKQHLGKVAFIDKDYDYAFGGFMGLIKPNDDICAKYIYYTCISSSYKHFLAGVGCGANITNLKFADLAQYTIPVPERAEQERIVGELDCLSGIIAAKRAQLRELDTLAQSIFYTMFGDPITNDKGWQTKKWESVYETKLGKMLDAKKQNDNDIVCPYIANLNVKWGRFDLENLKTMTFSLKEIELYKLQKGDLLICEGGEAGRCAIWDKSDSNILYQKAIHRSRVKNQDINSYYTLYFLYNFRKQGGLKDYLSKSTIEHLTREKLNTLRLPIPPIALQNEFAKKIEQIEKQKQLIKASITETEDLFNSRMNYYFD